MRLKEMRAGNNESGICELDGNFGPGAKRNLVGVAISHVGDLLIRGPGFVSFYLLVWKGARRRRF